MINCFDEWTQLEEVIVGNCYNASNTIDVSFNYFFWYQNNDYSILNKKMNLKINEKYINERQEDLDNLADILVGLGIKVYRPKVLDKISIIKNGEWSSYTHLCDNPRDQFLILGDTILETAPYIRSRYFENDLLKDVLYEKYEEGCKWLCMLKLLLNFEKLEIMFDGAQCMKLGEDILVNVNSNIHEMGYKWIVRHFPEYRFHKVNFCKDHLDGRFMIIKPGLMLLSSSAFNDRQQLNDIFKGWKFLHHIDLDNTKYNYDDIFLASNTIGVNVLVVNENLVIVNETEIETIKLLEKEKVNVIPIRFRHSRLFGGGIHCSTLDLKRKGKKDKYL